MIGSLIGAIGVLLTPLPFLFLFLGTFLGVTSARCPACRGRCSSR